MSKNSNVNPENLAKRFPDLNRAAEIAKAVLGHGYYDTNEDRTLEQLIYDEYNRLIDSFNNYENGIHDDLVPSVITLKRLLGGKKLPSIEEIGTKDLVRAIRDANYLMLWGQEIATRRKRGEEIPQEEVSIAIGAPSVKTSDQALAVGSAGHLIERAIMQYMPHQDVDTSEWEKDQVLWALEDLALLQNAVHYMYGDEYPLNPLFYYFTQDPKMDDSGGMGWRNLERAGKICDLYQEREQEFKQQLSQLIKSDDSESGNTVDIDPIPYDQALSVVAESLIRNIEDLYKDE